jgi:hypothetical protein
VFRSSQIARFVVFPPLLFALACAGQEQPGARETTEPLHFSAELVPENVVTGSPEETSDAHASVSAVLDGNTLTVNGAFFGLSSPLRDIDETPDDPGVHIHPGAAGEENPYLYGLQAELNEDERSGAFFGTIELSDEEVALLLDERLYIDIHTVEHGPGEVRDQFRAQDAAEAQTRAERVARELSVPGLGELAVRTCEEGAKACSCHTQPPVPGSPGHES